MRYVQVLYSLYKCQSVSSYCIVYSVYLSTVEWAGKITKHRRKPTPPSPSPPPPTPFSIFSRRKWKFLPLVALLCTCTPEVGLRNSREHQQHTQLTPHYTQTTPPHDTTHTTTRYMYSPPQFSFLTRTTPLCTTLNFVQSYSIYFSFTTAYYILSYHTMELAHTTHTTSITVFLPPS